MVIPNSIQITDVHQTERQKIVLSVGRLHYDKGHDVLLHALNIIRESLNGWKLKIVGDGERRHDLKELSANLNLEDYIEWAGTQKDVEKYYREASIFVLPSRREGLPNALLEAMAYKLPVVITNASPGPLEVVRESNSGKVVAADDPAALANALQQLIHSPEDRKRLGYAAQKYVEKHYAEDRVLDVWEQALLGP